MIRQPLAADSRESTIATSVVVAVERTAVVVAELELGEVAVKVLLAGLFTLGLPRTYDRSYTRPPITPQ